VVIFDVYFSKSIPFWWSSGPAIVGLNLKRDIVLIPGFILSNVFRVKGKEKVKV